MKRFKNRAIAGASAVLLAASLAACDTNDDDPNGTTGETDDTQIATTTSTPATDTTMDEMTTTTLGDATTTTAP